MNLGTILKSRLLSEKTASIGDDNGLYVFNVDPKASKKDVSSAVEKYFNVQVRKVNTVTIRGKVRRRGQKLYKLSNYKKAFVWLADGQKIKSFEET